MSETSDSDLLMNGEEWFAKNWRLLLSASLFVLILAVLFNWQSNSEAESAALSEKDLHSALLSSNSTNLVEIALELNGIHLKYPDVKVGERALILSANIALQSMEYEAAQERFESYVTRYPTGDWLSEAKIGIALCKESNGVSAIEDYQVLTNSLVESVKQRSSALLEAAKVNLEPLPSRPVPIEVQPKVDEAITPVEAVVPDQK